MPANHSRFRRPARHPESPAKEMTPRPRFRPHLLHLEDRITPVNLSDVIQAYNAGVSAVGTASTAAAVLDHALGTNILPLANHFLTRLARCRFTARQKPLVRQRGTIASGVDRGNKLFRICFGWVVINCSCFRRNADSCGFDAVYTLERIAHTDFAGGAGHALYRNNDAIHSGCDWQLRLR